MRGKHIIAYTDGSFSRLQKKGGWGVHLKYPHGKVEELWGGEAKTTNNIMEMKAVLVALEMTPDDVPLWIYTDSQYVQRSITLWIDGWQKNGWTTVRGHPVKNKELWLQIMMAMKGRDIRVHWVRGHNGNSGNERADTLAAKGKEELVSEVV